MLNEKDIKIIDSIEERIQKNSSFWNFKDNYHKEHIHGIFTYPATMVPRMQAEIIDIIMSIDRDINNIFDPFMGSGTILIEGLLRNLDVYGIDINPLAFFVVDVKTTPVFVNLLKNKTEILFKTISKLTEYEIVNFEKIEKWYTTSMINQLSKLRASILQEEDMTYRKIFWISFCETCRMSNNSQKSTFKLHIKNSLDIKNFKFDCIQFFKKHLIQNINRIDEFISISKNIKITNSKISFNNRVRILNGDSLILIRDKRRFKSNSIDLVCTSPPYGDNHTTVTYGQYSILPLKWIPLTDINQKLDSSILSTFTGIDRESLGGTNYTIEEINKSGILDLSRTLSEIYYNLIRDNELIKARKVVSFYIDFINVFKHISRVLKSDKYAVFTIGNRRVNNKIIEFDSIIKELCTKYNLLLIYNFQRSILNKRIAPKISKSKNNEPIKSMKEENVLILRKLNK